MSEPNTTRIKNFIDAATDEMCSAISSLHMPPDPKPNPAEDAFFLTELDDNVEHAMEHIRAAYQYMQNARQLQVTVNRAYSTLQQMLRDIKKDLPLDKYLELRAYWKPVMDDLSHLRTSGI